MSDNEIYEDGRRLSVTCSDPTTPASGDPVRWGHRIGVAIADEETDGTTSVDFGGVKDLSVKGINDDGNVAVAAGDPLYYVDADTPKISKKNSGYLVGYAKEAVTSAATATIEVILLGITPGVTSSADIADGSITEAKLATNSVTNAKIGDDAVDSAEIAAGAIDPEHFAASAVEAAAIAASAVETAKINAAAVTRAKLAGTFMKQGVQAGQDETGDTTIDVTGMVVGDELVSFFVQDGTSGLLTQRALADFTVGAGILTVGANAANNAANFYVIAWLDLT